MDELIKRKSAFSEIPDIGVVWVMDEASKLGFYHGNPDWSNLGQGEPETGEIAGAPPRITDFTIEPEDNVYGPLNGMLALRKAIAGHYNRLYRKGKSSLYTADNVSIAMGGRLALTRIFSILGSVRLGYKIPEYPAYQDLLNYQQERITSLCVPTKQSTNYQLSAAELANAITTLELDAFLLSNPCNPTGHVIKGEELREYLKTVRKQNCSLIIDEVYSHFIYDHGKPADAPVSAAEFIDDVNSDPVLIVDALTKSFRYPGWRLAWILGPKEVITDLGRAASGIDGGPSLPVQRAALQLFEPQRADQETKALREVFSRKQTQLLTVLRENGMICSEDANSTFYIWADISALPAPLNNSDSFFRKALDYKVMTVPGHLFDIHPGKPKHESDFNSFIRFSFGPTESNLAAGLERITALISSYR